MKQSEKKQKKVYQSPRVSIFDMSKKKPFAEMGCKYQNLTSYYEIEFAQYCIGFCETAADS